MDAAVRAAVVLVKADGVKVGDAAVRAVDAAPAKVGAVLVTVDGAPAKAGAARARAEEVLVKVDGAREEASRRVIRRPQIRRLQSSMGHRATRCPILPLQR